MEIPSSNFQKNSIKIFIITIVGFEKIAYNSNRYHKQSISGNIFSKK